MLCMCVGALLLGGCAILPDSERAAKEAGAFDHVLPKGWEAMGDWQPVNLDGDQEEENLLLFRFDAGQVGALIVEGDTATTISPPDRLLPRYFDEQGQLGQGVIAAPGTPTSAIAVTQIDGNIPMRELVILGGGTHLTFAWWKGGAARYSVTQLFAPGGFGVDWETWQEQPAPISSVMGYYPLEDYRARSNICNMTLYTRRTDLLDDSPAIVYRAEPKGLHFCNSVIPPHPYAPEGVVLAYLQSPRTGGMGLEDLLTPGTSVAQLDAESAYERFALEQIADIAAFPAVPMSQVEANAQGDVLVPTTSVCVEFAEIVNPTLRRWVVYTLRYQPLDAGLRLPDRWTVSGALTEPPPLEPPAADFCEEILNRSAP